MALLWADGFDHYGTTPNSGRDAMLSGAWAEVANTCFVTATQKRTGSLSLNHNPSAVPSSNRRVFPSAKDVVGVAKGVYVNNLPPLANVLMISEWRDVSNTHIAALYIQPDGSLSFQRGGTVLAVSPPVIPASAWSHLETKLTISNTFGRLEARINAETVLSASGLNLGSTPASSWLFGKTTSSNPGYSLWIDDLIAWDDTGAEFNSFVGQARVQTIFGNADLIPQQWDKVGSANAFACINNVPPDGDTTYISTANIGDTAEFSLSELAPETQAIAGVYIPVMAKLDGAGIGNVQVSLVSGSSVADGRDTPLTTAYTYWGSSYEKDPATGGAWTKASLEAAKLRLRKTL